MAESDMTDSDAVLRHDERNPGKDDSRTGDSGT
jgi:hypothetical protein